MADWCGKLHVQVWAYCLMPNHVHLIAVPETEEGLARAIGEAHRRYTRRIKFREGWRGYLWLERFASFPMDVKYLLAAIGYHLCGSINRGGWGIKVIYPQQKIIYSSNPATKLHVLLSLGVN